MGKQPDFIMRYGDDLETFARYVKIYMTQKTKRSDFHRAANRFWTEISEDGIAELTLWLEDLILQHRDDLDGFKAALASAEISAPSYRNLNKQILANSAEPLFNLVLEINTWRLGFSDDRTIAGAPAGMRRSLFGASGYQADAANAVAVWSGGRLRGPHVQNISI